MQERYLIIHLLLILLLITALFKFPIDSNTQSTSSFGIGPNDIHINLPAEVLPNDIPLRIMIEKADINMNIEFGKLNGPTWDVDETNANYAEGSSFLDEKYGNTIVYAHARNNMFITLNKVEIGDSINIFSDDKLYEYQVISKSLILPNQIDEIKSKGSHNLTLFTCEGISDEYRLLVKATRVNIISLPEEVI